MLKVDEATAERARGLYQPERSRNSKLFSLTKTEVGCTILLKSIVRKMRVFGISEGTGWGV
jgi:hypothetical protein